jgi:hypothetical protein
MSPVAHAVVVIFIAQQCYSCCADSAGRTVSIHLWQVLKAQEYHVCIQNHSFLATVACLCSLTAACSGSPITVCPQQQGMAEAHATHLKKAQAHQPALYSRHSNLKMLLSAPKLTIDSKKVSRNPSNELSFDRHTRSCTTVYTQQEFSTCAELLFLHSLKLLNTCTSCTKVTQLQLPWKPKGRLTGRNLLRAITPQAAGCLAGDPLKYTPLSANDSRCAAAKHSTICKGLLYQLGTTSY